MTISAVDEARAPKRATGTWRAHALWLALVVVLFCLPLFLGLGRTDLDNDESIYSFAVDVMLKSGDWLTPKAIPFKDVAFLEKPPLKFWIVAAPIRLGLLPLDEFGLRFWDALFGSLAFLYVFAIGRRLGGPLCGIAAVLALFAHNPLIFVHGLRSNNMEASVVLSYCAGVYHFMAWRTSEHAGSRRRHIVALALYFVLAFMTKFVAALFLPLLLAAAALVSREDRVRLERDRRAWLAAGGLAFALIAPWFLYQYHQFGGQVWHIMFGEHVLTRFTSYLDPGHLHPWYYYFSEMFTQLRASRAVIATFAGLVLLLWKSVRGGGREAALVLSWFALPLTLMSLLSSKLYHYAYPFVPPVALAAGYAAALAFGLLWSLGAAPSRRVDGFMRAAVPRVLQRPRVRVLLTALAVAGVAVAIATHAEGGRMRIAIGDRVLFTNASALRAWLVAAVMFALAARVGTALRVGAAAAIVLLLLPVPGYAQALAQLPVQRHPLRSLGECLQAVNSHAADPARRTPGVWAEAEVIVHTYFYYLRGLGDWQYRKELKDASDTTVYTHLYVPSQATPVLLSNVRYEQFTRVANARDPELIERVARKVGVDAPTVLAAANERSIAVVKFPEELMLLPGPYAGCAVAEGVRSPGR